jgi:DNA-binding LytR/AlgR family response regulator
MSQPVSPSDRRRATVLVYSSNEGTRRRILTALGARPSPGLELTFVQAETGREVVSICDGGEIDLAILDGEAAPTGGIGLGRQLKSELDEPPPVLLVVGRRDDAWLATWSRAEGVTAHPIDAVRITQAAVDLLTPAGVVATGH